MKYIEVARDKNDELLRGFANVFAPDIKSLAKSRELPLTLAQTVGLIYKLREILDRANVLCINDGLDIQLTRIEFEVMKNKSAKFTAVPLKENGEPALASERNPVLLFMATEEDIVDIGNKVKTIFSMPDQMPPLN